MQVAVIERMMPVTQSTCPKAQFMLLASALLPDSPDLRSLTAPVRREKMRFEAMIIIPEPKSFYELH
jgi:hypothetical protein